MQAGSVLRKRYKIIKLIGSGGFGDTYLAEDGDLPNRPYCVVKHLRPKSSSPLVLEAAQTLFNREAEVLYRLGKCDDRLPSVFAYFEEDSEFFLVQEFVDGVDLSHELLPGKKLSEDKVETLLREILDVLEVVHQHGVIHRDIKPHNLMRRRQDNRIVLVDFGAVKEIGSLNVDSQGNTTTTIAIGTADYMPSEQSYGHPKFASDVYAVGVIGIQALLGEIPSKDPDTGELLWQDRASVSPKFAKFLETMVRYDFRQRYSSATEALQGLTQTQVNLQRQALIGDTVEKPNPLKKNVQVGKIKFFAVASVSALVVTGAGLQFFYSDLPPCQFRLGAKKISDSTVTNIYSFSENGLAPIEIDHKWGFMNLCGHIAIDANFKDVWTFKQGLAVVKDKQDLYGYIDHSGKDVFPNHFKWANSFYEGLAAVQDNSGLYGFIDKTGTFKIQPMYKDVGNFVEGLARVQNESGVWGYINSLGTYVIKPKYLNAEDFSSSYALVENSQDGWIYIDRSGKNLEIQSIKKIRRFSEELAAVLDDNGRWGYINSTGQYAIQPQFSYAGEFSEGLAVVQSAEGGYGYIGKKGNYIISPRFYDAWKFEDNVAVVQEKNNRFGYIDREGKYLFSKQFDDAYPFHQGVALVKDSSTKKWGFIERSGEYKIDPIFDQAYSE